MDAWRFYLMIVLFVVVFQILSMLGPRVRFRYHRHNILWQLLHRFFLLVRLLWLLGGVLALLLSLPFQITIVGEVWVRAAWIGGTLVCTQIVFCLCILNRRQSIETLE